MAFWEQFPYTNFHEMNLEWLAKAMKDLKDYVKNYVAINKVAYAGIWNITKQYPQWSVVSNGDKTYMSKIAVPSGIAVDNGDYWIELADLDPRIGGILERLNNVDQTVNILSETIDQTVNILSEKIDNIGVLDLRPHNGENLNDYYDGKFRGFIVLPQSMRITETINIESPCYILGGGCSIESTVNNCFVVKSPNCVIRGIAFTYTGIVVDPDYANNAVITIENGANDNDIENCTFTNFYAAAISVNSENNEINNCAVNLLKTSFIAAFWVGPLSKYCLFSDCTVTNCNLDGFHVEGRNITISSCKIDNCGLRPSIPSGALGACGIYGGRLESNRPVNLVVDNCTISNCSESGIDLGSSAGRFTNCEFYRNALNGILLASNYRNIIANNIFTENGWSEVTGVADFRKSTIACENSCYTVNVSNNIIRGASSSKYAIDFPDGNNQMIVSNIIENSNFINVREDSSILVVNNIRV